MTKRKKVAAGSHHVPDALLIGQAGLGKGILPHTTEELTRDDALITRVFAFDPKDNLSSNSN